MKLFSYGAVFGAIIVSLFWCSIGYFSHKYAPDIPFNNAGTYKIQSATRYIVIKKNHTEPCFELHRGDKSINSNNSSNILISYDWFKSEDWFTYVDAFSRVWLYNGDNELIVLVERDGVTYSYAAKEFIPEDAILSKIPYSYVRKTWNKDVQRRWQRLNECEQIASSNH
jgi:hypothetical protein